MRSSRFRARSRRALSAGTNALLRLGATPLTRTEDVLESFGIAPAEQAISELEPTAAAVLEHVRDRAAGADELARDMGLSAGELAAALTELELPAPSRRRRGSIDQPARTTWRAQPDKP